MVTQQNQSDRIAPLSKAERDELERLREEVTTLHGGANRQPPSPRPGRARRWGRTFAAVLLIVLACVLAPLSVTSVWARSMVVDTNRYVDTMAPLAKDPAIQDAITANITRTVFTYVDIKGLTTRTLTALADTGRLPTDVAAQLPALAGPITTGVQNFTEDQVRKVVESAAFAQAWETANRTAHQTLVAALTGQGGTAVTVKDGTVSVNLSPLIATVKQQLVAAGFQLAEKIPAVNASFVVYQSADITKIQKGFHLLNRLGFWLPIICLVLIGLGVYAARNHRLAFIGAGLGVALAMLAVAIALQVVRGVYLRSVPPDVLPADAATVLYDGLVRFLREAVRAGILLGLVVAAGAFLTGPSVTARRTRQVLVAGLAVLRRGLYRLGLKTDRVTAWVAGHAGLLRTLAVVAAFLVLILVTYRTPALVLWLTVAVLGALFIIQLLATPVPARPVGAPVAGPAAGPGAPPR
jgi:hypothetical protein